MRFSVRFAASTLLFVSPFVRADGFRNPPDTAAALGKAGKHTAWSDDPSAVFYNPANLSAVGTNQVQFSGLLGYSHADYSGPLGRTETIRPWSLLPAFAAAWPLEGTSLAVGLGAHVPYGRQTRWETDGPFRYAAPAYSQLTVADLTPALAWRPTESLALGAGFDFYYGRLGFRQRLPVLPGSRLTAEADGYACGAHAGITWAPTPGQRLALTYQAPFDIEFHGDLDADSLPPPAVSESSLETTFKFPAIAALGYGLRLSETVRFEAGVEWLQFSRFKTMSFDAGHNNPLLGALGLSSLSQDWRDTWTFGLGPEWRFARDWTLRAGYLYLQSPTPDDTFAPSALDVNQSLVSLGLGYRTGRHAVDLAYAVGLFQTRRVDANQNALYQQADYDFEGHLAALSYTCSF